MGDDARRSFMQTLLEGLGCGEVVGLLPRGALFPGMALATRAYPWLPSVICLRLSSLRYGSLGSRNSSEVL